jgi:hypothetical protein
MNSKYLVLLGGLLLPIPFATAADTNPAAASATAPASDEAGFSGKVIEALNTAGYTYVQVDTGSKKLWAATTQFDVKVGDTVAVGKGNAMPDFHSKSLNRTFDVVYFTSSIVVAGSQGSAPPSLPPGHPPIPGASTPALPPGHPALTAPPAQAPNLELTGIKRAEGGKTIKEIYAAKSKLAGKTVSVRGRVVKYNAMILGKNWLHIRDGSGNPEKADNDLAVTTSTPTGLGAIVVVTGTVSTNRDFGAGYKYGVIIENAQVTVEPK